ncbi:MAG TPA: DUF4197 domain-containing protein [Steroidobacteraceae bacterium]|jgi:hypothetical protein|nr:DUF4197 domain-containing protein [Steroidobacteraceae bacterium]
MKRKILAGAFMLAALGCGVPWGGAFGLDVSSLSNADASAGLKKALDQGINLAVGKLGVTDGFLKNPEVKIDLPPKLAKAESMMRMLGVGDQLDQLVTAMNRAAESAVPESKVLLKQALKQMSLADAKRILTGGNDAATQYFKQATYTPLQAKFAPIIGRATAKVKLGETYDALAKKAVALGVLKPEDATLQSYVTDKTLDGLYLMMAEEERAIRRDPLGQANGLIKKVFGALR